MADCSSEWTLMYENNQNGFDIYGTLDDLHQAIKSGGLVRVYLPGLDSASDAHRIHTIGNGHICAELPKRIRYWKSNNESAESDAYWSLTMTCTSGHFEELRKYVGTEQSEATGITIYMGDNYMADCSSEWTLMYENNQNGFDIYGTLDDLHQAIKSGGLVRVYLPGLDSASDAHRIHTIGNGHICAELPKRIRYWKSNNESAESDAYWSLTMTCTSGHFEELRKYVGTEQSEATGITIADTRWYVKYHSMSNMALHGHDRLHDHDRLRMSVANGFPVHGVAVGRDRTDVIPLHAVTDACSDCIFGQAIDAVELRNCSGSRCEFRRADSFWLSQQMTPHGHIRTTGTKMDDYSGTLTLDNDEKFDWFADTC